MQPSDFAALYHASVSHIRQLVFSVTGDHQTVEDILQDIYLAAWIRFRNEQHPNPMGWLLLTARHKAYDQLRRQIRESEHFLPSDLSDETAIISTGLFDHDPHLDMVCEQDSPYEKVSPLLQGDELALLLEYYNDGFPIHELAKKRRISSSACRMRLHRAKKKLDPLIKPSS